jgi:hypothetical protein
MAETQNSKQNVQAPQAGQTVIVNAIPGQDIVLEAAFDQAEVKMDGGNVIFEFANGGQVVLNFSDIGTAQAPNVVMPDGTILNMEEFLASLGEKEVEPAAGPEGGGEGSGGVGEYRDDAGNLIGGVDKAGRARPEGLHFDQRGGVGCGSVAGGRHDHLYGYAEQSFRRASDRKLHDGERHRFSRIRLYRTVWNNNLCCRSDHGNGCRACA